MSKILTLKNENANAFRELDQLAKQIDSTPDDQLDAVIARSDSLNTEIRERTEKIAKLEGASKAGDAARAALAEMSEPVYGDEAKPVAKATEARSYGRQFVDSKEFRAYHKGKGGDALTGGALGDSPVVQLEATRALIGKAGLTTPERVQGIVNGLTPVELLDLIPVLSTASDAVQYLRYNGYTNTAKVVPETTQASRNHATNGVKPESSLDIAMATATVETIAHAFFVSRQAYADVDRLAEEIDLYGEDGLKQAKCNAILNGDGNIEGLLQNAGVQSQAFSATLRETIRKAITKARVEGRSVPNGLVLHPLTAEKLDLEVDGEGRYYFGGPNTTQRLPVWSLKVVEDEHLPLTSGAPTLGVLGDFALGCAWYKRQDPTLYSTDSHADLFLRNVLTILMELRGAFAIRKPKSFVKFGVA